MGEFLIEWLDRYFDCKPDAVMLVLAVAYDFYVMIALALLIAGR